MIIRAGDLGRSLLTGGRCSEVAVSTGLTVFHKLFKVEHDSAFFASLFHSEHTSACVRASACERARQISRVPKRD